MRAKHLANAIALVVAIAATPALARHDRHADYPDRAYPGGYPAPVQAAFPVDSALAERCGLYAGAVRPFAYDAGYDGWERRRDNGLGGALIGGAAGGVIGNRIAGRGDRALGTVAGAAVGAVAGAAIDRAEDRPALRPPGYADECDAALPPGYRLVAVPGPAPECRDEVVTHEEWVPEYVTVQGSPRRAAPLRDKRTRLRRVK